MYRLILGAVVVLLFLQVPADAAPWPGGCMHCRGEYESCVDDARNSANAARAATTVLCAIVLINNAPGGIICGFFSYIAINDRYSTQLDRCRMRRNNCEAECDERMKQPTGGNN